MVLSKIKIIFVLSFDNTHTDSAFHEIQVKHCVDIFILKFVCLRANTGTQPDQYRVIVSSEPILIVFWSISSGNIWFDFSHYK